MTICVTELLEWPLPLTQKCCFPGSQETLAPQDLGRPPSPASLLFFQSQNPQVPCHRDSWHAAATPKARSHEGCAAGTYPTSGNDQWSCVPWAEALYPISPAASLAAAGSKSSKTKVVSLFFPAFNLLAVPPIGRTKSEAIWQENLGLHIVSRLPTSCDSEQSKKSGAGTVSNQQNGWCTCYTRDKSLGTI